MANDASDVTNNKQTPPGDEAEFTEEELAALTDEEREALDVEDKPEDKGEDKPENKPEDKPNEDEPENEPEDDGDSDEDEPEDGDNPDEDEPEDDDKPSDPLGVVEAETSVYKPTVAVVEYTDEDYRADIKAVVDKYEDGDLEEVDKEIEMGRLWAKKNDADTSVDRAAQAETDAWEADQRAFFANNERFETDPIINGALNSAVIALANSDAGNGLNGAQILQQAAKQVLALMGEVAGSKDEKVEDKAEDKKRPRPKKDMSKSPDAVGNIPAAGDNSASKGLFDKLDSMEGEELETAVAALSDADRRKYESMA